VQTEKTKIHVSVLTKKEQ